MASPSALPLGVAFFLRSARGEKGAGYFVVAAIFFSALVALWQTVERLIDSEPLSHLVPLAVAGAVGFIGNEIAALIRLRAGERLASPALVADGYHARTDGLVSLGVVGSAIVVAIGFDLADPLIGLAITLTHPADHLGVLADDPWGLTNRARQQLTPVPARYPTVGNQRRLLRLNYAAE